MMMLLEVIPLDGIALKVKYPNVESFVKLRFNMINSANRGVDLDSIFCPICQNHDDNID